MDDERMIFTGGHRRRRRHSTWILGRTETRYGKFRRQALLGCGAGAGVPGAARYGIVS